MKTLKDYIVKVRLVEQEMLFGRLVDKHDFFECKAESEADARSQAGWAYIRIGTVVSVDLVDPI